MGASKIEWCDATWNPVTGCTKISEGCKSCYASKMAHRLQAMNTPGYENGFKVTLHPKRLAEPLKWKKPRRIFVVSMGDLFHEDVPFGFIDRILFEVVRKCEQHTFIVLTKRAGRMFEYFHADPAYPVFPNLWLGVTVEDQAQADKRIPILLATPAAVRFVSVEPMLSDICLSQNWVDYLAGWTTEAQCCGRGLLRNGCCCGDPNPVQAQTENLDWVIAGCESGQSRRPAERNWFRSLRNQCQDAGVPFFLKQAEIDGQLVKMPMLDGRFHNEMPKENEHA